MGNCVPILVGQKPANCGPSMYFLEMRNLARQLAITAVITMLQPAYADLSSSQHMEADTKLQTMLSDQAAWSLVLAEVKRLKIDLTRYDAPRVTLRKEGKVILRDYFFWGKGPPFVPGNFFSITVNDKTKKVEYFGGL